MKSRIHFLSILLILFTLTGCNLNFLFDPIEPVQPLEPVQEEPKFVEGVELRDGHIYVNGLHLGGWTSEHAFDVMGDDFTLLTEPGEYGCEEQFYFSYAGGVYFMLYGAYEDNWFTPNDYFSIVAPSPISDEGFEHVGLCHFKNHDNAIFNGLIIDEADVNAFRLSSSGTFIRDDMHVFDDGGVISKDPEHFETLEGYYGKDSTQVYSWGKPIVGADPMSFEVIYLPHLDLLLGRDKYTVYFQGEEVEGYDGRPLETLSKTDIFPNYLK